MAAPRTRGKAGQVPYAEHLELTEQWLRDQNATSWDDVLGCGRATSDWEVNEMSFMKAYDYLFAWFKAGSSMVLAPKQTRQVLVHAASTFKFRNNGPKMAGEVCAHLNCHASLVRTCYASWHGIKSTKCQRFIKTLTRPSLDKLTELITVML